MRVVKWCMDCGKEVFAYEVSEEEAEEQDLYGRADGGEFYFDGDFYKNTICHDCYPLPPNPQYRL